MEVIDGARFRQVMGRFITGVTVVTTFADDFPQGITVSALATVSLEPPLIMVALDRRRFITPLIRAYRRFAVNVLSEGQQTISDCFAHAAVKPGREDFCGAAWHPGPSGLPFIDGALTSLECTVVETFETGDHDLFIGRVDAIGDDDQLDEEAGPLLYFRRRYLRIEQAADTAVKGKPEA